MQMDDDGQQYDPTEQRRYEEENPALADAFRRGDRIALMQRALYKQMQISSCDEELAQLQARRNDLWNDYERMCAKLGLPAVLS